MNVKKTASKADGRLSLAARFHYGEINAAGRGSGLILMDEAPPEARPKIEALAKHEMFVVYYSAKIVYHVRPVQCKEGHARDAKGKLDSSIRQSAR